MAPDSLRGFSVLSSLTNPPAFDSATARLRFAGQNVLVYVDTLAQTGFSDADIAAFGTLFDESLYGVIRGTFGNPSDIDGNGRIIIVLTPIVNALVSSAECAVSGYVRGFFYSHDLASSEPTSNHGEVFYATVPDPTGRWSCEHTKEEMLAVTPPTFVHEFQHMISYAQHVIERDGASETPWLNEGLSHLAEELGSLYFERKYPAPAGRSNPTQIFPDSASAFITPNLRYAHRFLFLSTSYSIVSCAPGSFCSLPERAATWLFLRWLGDQKGDDVFRRLDQTPSDWRGQHRGRRRRATERAPRQLRHCALGRQHCWRSTHCGRAGIPIPQPQLPSAVSRSVRSAWTRRRRGTSLSDRAHCCSRTTAWSPGPCARERLQCIASPYPAARPSRCSAFPRSMDNPSPPKLARSCRFFASASHDLPLGADYSYQR